MVVCLCGFLGSLATPQSADIEARLRAQAISGAEPDGSGKPSSWGQWLQVEIPFQMGRLAVLFLLGCGSGLIGQFLFEGALLTGTVRYVWLYVALFVCLLYFGAGVWGRLAQARLAWLEQAKIVKFGTTVLKALPVGLRNLVLGWLAGFFPDRFSLAFLLLALVTWDVTKAGVLMAGFGLSVLAGTLLMGFRPSDILRQLGNRLAATSVLGFSLYLVLLFLGFSFENGEFGLSSGEHSNHAVSADSSVVMLNTPVADFSVTDLEGKPQTLSAYKGKTVVLVTVGTHCPCVESYRNRLNVLANNYRSRDVVFLGFNSNANEPDAAIRKHLAVKPLAFPVIADTDQKLAEKLASACMTETYLIDAQGVLRYHGRIDDNIYHPEKVT
ncbi:MAG TPA: redoxin family protein, partial [Acidobacteriota bacterium]|nr:redoxin family protein [Acidobacteriota bacterium]